MAFQDRLSSWMSQATPRGRQRQTQVPLPASPFAILGTHIVVEPSAVKVGAQTDDHADISEGWGGRCTSADAIAFPRSSRGWIGRASARGVESRLKRSACKTCARGSISWASDASHKLGKITDRDLFLSELALTQREVQHARNSLSGRPLAKIAITHHGVRRIL